MTRCQDKMAVILDVVNSNRFVENKWNSVNNIVYWLPEVDLKAKQTKKQSRELPAATGDYTQPTTQRIAAATEALLCT